MRLEVNPAGLLLAVFVGALSYALGASLPWAIVIGLGWWVPISLVIGIVITALENVSARSNRRRSRRLQAARIAKRNRRGF